MDFVKTETYTQVKPGENSVENVLNEVENYHLKFSDEHLIIDFSEKNNTNIDNLLVFLNISATCKENGTSFVIICNGIDIDEIPDEINVVPSFTEAKDILEMDAIERDLGF